MQNNTIVRRLAGFVAVIALGVPLVGCAVTPADGAADPGKSVDQLQMEAEDLVRKSAVYEGDPWEARFREQFWSTQHIHDSWNRCHLGENVPSYLQQGPGC
jgi:hypothetical protein